MKATNKPVISLLMITGISIFFQANVLYAGNLKKVIAPLKDALSWISPNSLAPEMPREATFEDETASIDEKTLINLYPMVPAEADFNEDAASPGLTGDFTVVSASSVTKAASERKSPEMKSLQKTVKALLVSPDFILTEKEDKAEFYLTFRLSDDGKIIIKELNAPSKRLEEYVKEKLSSFVYDGPADIQPHTYRIKLRFQNS